MDDHAAIGSMYEIDNTIADYDALDTLRGSERVAAENQMLARACWKRADAARKREDFSEFGFGYYVRRAADASKAARFYMRIW